MFGVCWSCGEWEPEKDILERSDHAVAVCPDCNYEQPFRYLPLLVVTGASGAGKSTVLHEIVNQAVTGETTVTDSLVPIESDALWGAGAEMETVAYTGLWQRVCAGIHQAGRPVLLFGAGLNPENMEPTAYRRYFPTIHYLALIADDDALAARLEARPDWRGSNSPESIREHLDYNRALQSEELSSEGVPIETLDTTDQSVEASVSATANWILSVLSDY